jgi:hypothetical protein
MKTHKIKWCDEDGDYRTICGLNSWHHNSEELLLDNLVGLDDECTCKRCNIGYPIYKKAEEKRFQNWVKEMKEYNEAQNV